MMRGISHVTQIWRLILKDENQGPYSQILSFTYSFAMASRHWNFRELVLRPGQKWAGIDVRVQN